MDRSLRQCDEGSKPEILSRISQTAAALTGLKPVWNDRSISLSSKKQLMRSLVMSIFLYTCKSWTLTAELQRRIQAMEMRCYCKILHFSYKDHVTNEEVNAKIQQAIWPHEDLLTIVKRRKLQWYGHVSRSSGLAKDCKAQWQGEEDKADRGRGGKTTSGNGQAWSSPNPGEKRRKLVVKSSTLPQQPSRLRDGWLWWTNIRANQ